MNEITEQLWDILRGSLPHGRDLPPWMEGLLSRTFDLIGQDSDVMISTERKQLDESYIEFLRQQVRISARGPSWNEILERRISALEPYVGREVISIMFSRQGEIVLVRLVESPDIRLIYYEND